MQNLLKLTGDMDKNLISVLQNVTKKKTQLSED